jgi:ABC-type phosphate transport system substrate-binding protein
VAAGILLLASVNAWAGDAKVIANPSISAGSISASDLQSIFLEESSSLGGTHVEPVLEKGGPAHEAFLRQYLDKNDSALQTYYRSLVFTGKGSMPKALASDAEVVAYVARTKGAIGYVSAAASTEGVKVLDVK